MGAAVGVDALVVDFCARVTTRFAVIALCPAVPVVSLPVTTSTEAPVLKALTVSGRAFVPYFVAAVMVTLTLEPSAFCRVQVEPDTDVRTPTTDEPLTPDPLEPFVPPGPAAVDGADGVVIGADGVAAEPEAGVTDTADGDG